MLTEKQWMEEYKDVFEAGDGMPLAVSRFKRLLTGDVVFVREIWPEYDVYVRFKNITDANDESDKRTHNIVVSEQDRAIWCENNRSDSWDVVGDDAEFDVVLQTIKSKTIREEKTF